MKLAYSKYTLVEHGSRQPKEGALLRIELAKDKFGYADIHPCVKRGDLPLKDQLALLSEREKTQLTAQSLLFARFDALARKEKHYLFKDLTIPESNILIVNDHQDLESALKSPQVVKIKIGTDWKGKMDRLRTFLNTSKRPNASLRFDFSETLTEDSFSDFLTKNKDILPYVDYFEDPYLYDSAKWENSRNRFNVRLGCDHKSAQALRHPNSCDVIIVKPATQIIDNTLFRRLRGRQLVITSYLDHPIGQLCAAYVAAGAKRAFPKESGICGVTTHQVFDPTPYSQRLQVENGRLLPPKKGHGWGYDDLLKGMTWVLL
jgi:O-succinylbenzoate synthase